MRSVGSARPPTFASAAPFNNYNRLHAVPPCIVSEAEAKEGLAILDEVFTVIDRCYEG
jgi:hypothetical protein